MATRSRGPLAGFGWLKNAINLGHGNPKAVLGGAALVGIMSLLPSLITLPIQLGTTPGRGMLVALFAISMLGGLLLVPLVAGYMQVLHAADRGLAAKATDVFAPYRRGEAMRLIGYGLAMLAVYALVLVIIVAVAGGGIVNWYLELLSAQGRGEAAMATQALPEGFGIAVALALAFGLLLSGVYSISLGQVALGGRSVVGSVGDGVIGSLKNVLPLLVLAISAVVLMLVFALGFGLLVFGLMLVGKLVGEWLAIALLVPVYCGLMLVLLVVMFGVMYHLWRDVCGGDAHLDAADAALAA